MRNYRMGFVAALCIAFLISSDCVAADPECDKICISFQFRIEIEKQKQKAFTDQVQTQTKIETTVIPQTSYSPPMVYNPLQNTIIYPAITVPQRKTICIDGKCYIVN